MRGKNRRKVKGLAFERGSTGLTQSDISRLGKMKTDGFSQERMQNALRRLGMDIEIRINRRADGGLGTLKVFQTK